MAPHLTAQEHALVEELQRLRAHGRTVIGQAAAARAASRELRRCIAPAEQASHVWRLRDELPPRPEVFRRVDRG